MLKWLLISLVFLGILSCGSKQEEPVEVDLNKSGSNEIRIYADTIGWDGKLLCRIMYNGKDLEGGVKFRGGMSSKYPKHSMTLELNESVSLAGIPANDDWILNASYIDKTFLRHKLSYDLFRAMHNDNKAPRCAYIPVYLNDQFIGLYVVMEKVNGSWLGFDRNNPNGARLFKDPFVFVEERLPDVQEPDNYYQQKFPKQSLDDCNHELDAFKNFLFKSDDSTFVKTYKNWVNERNVIDWHLLLLFTNNDDGVIKNFYLYREVGESQFQFIPWDYDHSFGRDGNYELNLIERKVGWRKAILLRRLMEIPQTGYAERLKKRYLELRSNLFTEASLSKMINDNDLSGSDFLKANFEVWPLNDFWYSDDNDYKEEIEIIRTYIPMRLQQLDNFFTNLDYGEEEKD